MCSRIRLRTALVHLTAGVTSSGLHSCKAMGLLAAGTRQMICKVPTPTGEWHASIEQASHAADGPRGRATEQGTEAFSRARTGCCKSA